MSYQKHKVSKEIETYVLSKKYVLEFFSKTSATRSNISLYCATAGMPLIPTYYFLITENNEESLKEDFYRLCKFYDMEVDVEI